MSRDALEKGVFYILPPPFCSYNAIDMKAVISSIHLVICKYL